MTWFQQWFGVIIQESIPVKRKRDHFYDYVFSSLGVTLQAVVISQNFS